MWTLPYYLFFMFSLLQLTWKHPLNISYDFYHIAKNFLRQERSHKYFLSKFKIFPFSIKNFKKRESRILIGFSNSWQLKKYNFYNVHEMN